MDAWQCDYMSSGALHFAQTANIEMTRNLSERQENSMTAQQDGP